MDSQVLGKQGYFGAVGLHSIGIYLAQRARTARIRIIPVVSQVLDINEEARDVDDFGIITLLITSKPYVPSRDQF